MTLLIRNLVHMAPKFASVAVALSFNVIAAPAPGNTFSDCPDCPEIMVVPAGEFVMGSTTTESGHADEKPQHTVRIAKPFGVGKFEVTFSQWTRVPKPVAAPRQATTGSDAETIRRSTSRGRTRKHIPYG